MALSVLRADGRGGGGGGGEGAPRALDGIPPVSLSSTTRLEYRHSGGMTRCSGKRTASSGIFFIVAFRLTCFNRLRRSTRLYHRDMRRHGGGYEEIRRSVIASKRLRTRTVSTTLGRPRDAARACSGMLMISSHGARAFGSRRSYCGASRASRGSMLARSVSPRMDEGDW